MNILNKSETAILSIVIPTTFMFGGSFSPVPECVVISVLEPSFSDLPVPPEPRCYC